MSLRDILDKVSLKEISPAKAEKMLKLLAVDELGCLAKLDGNRDPGSYFSGRQNTERCR
jgi:NCAIR mutase (PurE)-related protein